MSLDQGKMMIAYDRKRTSTLTLDERPGAHTGNVRQYIPGYSDSNIVYLDTVSGNDSNDGSTELLAKLTYASAATAAGSTKKIRVINNGAALSTNINKPTEMKRGVSGTISSSLTDPLNSLTAAATPAWTSGTPKAIAWSPKLKKWCAIGNTEITSSSDGNTWSLEETVTGTVLYSIKWVQSAQAFYVVGTNGKLYYSDDGSNWTSQTIGSETLASVFYSDIAGKFIIGATGCIYTSEDAISWDRTAISSVVFITGFAETADSIYCATTGGELFASSNGMTWTRTTPFGSYGIESFGYMPNVGLLIAADLDGEIFSSSDGLVWTSRRSASGSPVYGFEFIYETGYAVVCEERTIIRSANGTAWTASGTLTAYPSSNRIYGISYSPLVGRLMTVGGGGVSDRITAFGPLYGNTISADIAGFTVQAVQYSGTVTAYNCTMKQPGTTASLSLNGCRVTETDAHISSNTQKHTATLFEHDFHMTCTPAAQNDVQVNKCTFAESLYIYNASATAYEQVRDNIIEGGIKADYNVTVSGRDNIRGTSTNLLRGASVTSGDPKFASETDYTLQFQTNGYARNSLAVGRSAIYFNSAGDARDLGAWSYVESAISYYYAKNSYINKGQDITVTIEETVSEQQGDNGPVSVYTNVNRIKEVLTIQYGSTDDTDRAIFDYIRTLTDKGVKIQLDPEFSSNGSTVTVNGNQSAGVEFLTVDSVATFNGMFLTISDKRYWVMRASPSASAATKLILDRPLEDAVTDNQVITTNYPSGAGEYQFSPPPQLALKRKDNSGLLTWKEGLVLRFVREWSA